MDPRDAAAFWVAAPGRGEIRTETLAAPAAGEVEIRVHATGLNFKDVLNTLGMYPGDAGPLGVGRRIRLSLAHVVSSQPKFDFGFHTG